MIICLCLFADSVFQTSLLIYPLPLSFNSSLNNISEYSVREWSVTVRHLVTWYMNWNQVCGNKTLLYRKSNLYHVILENGKFFIISVKAEISSIDLTVWWLISVCPSCHSINFYHCFFNQWGTSVFPKSTFETLEAIKQMIAIQAFKKKTSDITILQQNWSKIFDPSSWKLVLWPYSLDSIFGRNVCMIYRRETISLLFIYIFLEPPPEYRVLLDLIVVKIFIEL